MKPAYAERAARDAAVPRGLGLHWSEFVAILGIVDALIVAAVMVAVVAAWDRVARDFIPTQYYGVWFAGTWVVWLLALRASGSYDLLEPTVVRRPAASLVRALAIVVGITLVVYFFAPRAFPRSTSLLTPLPVFVGLLVWREAAATRLPRWRALHRRILLLGIGETTTRLAAVLTAEARRVPYDCVAFLTERDDAPSTIGALPVRRDTAALWQHVRELGVQEIAVAREAQLSHQTRGLLLDCFHAGVTVTDAAQLYEDLTGRVPVAQIAPTWYAELPSLPRRLYRVMKRAVDVVGAAVLLVVLSPVLLAIAIAVVVDDGWPFLYAQVRLGQRGRPFVVRKFRSMRRDAEENGARYAERGDPRSTRVGRFLRPSGLDELPQLWDVLIGRMSLIGPRAERPEFTDRLAEMLPLYRARLLVRPGIVGWAEVHVRHAADLEQHLERLEYDLYYIKRADLLLDVDIALRAVALAVTGRR
ncbi:MAG: exopolysaccharide biosynthesis polyprenyl glycosylphosphotransferase [Chloroflexota bacterium]|nr:exopolysaccharide biosynthesis polyprenyl glycosylphosphotransferase [Chloroflexota bacterium]